MKELDSRVKQRKERAKESQGLATVSDANSKFMHPDALPYLRAAAAHIDAKVAEESADKREANETAAIANYHGAKAQDKAAKQAETAEQEQAKGGAAPTEAQLQGAQPAIAHKTGAGSGWKKNDPAAK